MQEINDILMRLEKDSDELANEISIVDTEHGSKMICQDTCQMIRYYVSMLKDRLCIKN